MLTKNDNLSNQLFEHITIIMRQNLLLFLSIAFFASCNSEGCHNSAIPPHIDSTEEVVFQKRVVLIIDISSSLTESNQKMAAQYAGQVAKYLGDDSQLLIYTTEKNTSQQAIVDAKKSVPLKPSARADFEARIWPLTVNATYNTVFDKCKKSESNSCIIDGLKSVITGLSNASKAHDTYLLIVSDMLECCELGCPKQAKEFEAMKIKIIKSDLNDFHLATKIPLDHLKICLTTQDVAPQSAELIASPEFREFWKEAFKMLGYPTMPEPGTGIDSFLDIIKD